MELLQAVRSPIEDDHIDAGQPGLVYHEQDVRLLRLMGLQHAFDHDVQQCGPVPISAQNKNVQAGPARIATRFSNVRQKDARAL